MVKKELTIARSDIADIKGDHTRSYAELERPACTSSAKENTFYAPQIQLLRYGYSNKKIAGLLLVFLGMALSLGDVRLTGAVIGGGFFSLIGAIGLMSFLIGGVMVLMADVRKGEAVNNLVSRVKEDPRLYSIAKEFNRNEIIQRDINHLVSEFAKGHPSPGLGRRHLFKDVYELKGRNGARVYHRQTGKKKYEVLAYSDKHNQNQVINRLKTVYS